MEYCNYCGEKVVSDAGYCSRCGKQIQRMDDYRNDKLSSPERMTAVKKESILESGDTKENGLGDFLIKFKWVLAVLVFIIGTASTYVVATAYKEAKNQNSGQQAAQPVSQQQVVQTQQPQAVPSKKRLSYENYGGLYAAKIMSSSQGDWYLLRDFSTRIDNNTIEFGMILVPRTEPNVKTVTMKYNYQRGDSYATVVAGEIKYIDNSIERSSVPERVDINTDSPLEIAIEEVQRLPLVSSNGGGIEVGSTLGNVRKSYNITKLYYGGEGCFYAYIKDLDQTLQIIIPFETKELNGSKSLPKEWINNPNLLPDSAKVNEVSRGDIDKR